MNAIIVITVLLAVGLLAYWAIKRTLAEDTGSSRKVRRVSKRR